MTEVELFFAEDRINDIRTFYTGLLNILHEREFPSYYVSEVSFPKKEFEQGAYPRPLIPRKEIVNANWTRKERGEQIIFKYDHDAQDSPKGRVSIKAHNYLFFVLSSTIYSDLSISQFNDKKEGLRLGILDFEDVDIITDGAELIYDLAYEGKNVTLVSDLRWGGDDRDKLRSMSGFYLLDHLSNLDDKDIVRKFALSSFTSEKTSGNLTDLALEVESRMIDKGERDNPINILSSRDWDIFFNYGILPFVQSSPSAVKSSVSKTDLANLRDRYGIVGSSEELKNVLRDAIKAAQYDVNVLIRGENGVGKGLIATILHEESTRSAGPMIPVNSSAIASSLAESELFGHEQGAFTNATQQRVGLIEQADGGTLFFDEIGDMSWSLQPKILRVLEDKEIMRVGGQTSIPVDVRFIAATNKNLQEEIMMETFREDLYHRLNVFSIDIPPLRNRQEDILPIFSESLRKFENDHDIPKHSITDDAEEFLKSYRWHGNVRQLQNVAQSVAVFSEGDDITTYDLIDVLDDETEKGDRKTYASDDTHIEKTRLDQLDISDLLNHESNIREVVDAVYYLVSLWHDYQREGVTSLPFELLGRILSRCKSYNRIENGNMEVEEIKNINHNVNYKNSLRADNIKRIIESKSGDEEKYLKNMYSKPFE